MADLDQSGHGTSHRAYVDPDDGRRRTPVVIPETAGGKSLRAGYSVISQGVVTLDFSATPNAEIVIPASARGITIGPTSDSPSLFWISFGSDPGVLAQGFRVNTSSIEDFGFSNTTAYLYTGAGGDSEVYYVIYGDA